MSSEIQEQIDYLQNRLSNDSNYIGRYATEMNKFSLKIKELDLEELDRLLKL